MSDNYNYPPGSGDGPEDDRLKKIIAAIHFLLDLVAEDRQDIRTVAATLEAARWKLELLQNANVRMGQELKGLHDHVAGLETLVERLRTDVADLRIVHAASEQLRSVLGKYGPSTVAGKQRDFVVVDGCRRATAMPRQETSLTREKISLLAEAGLLPGPYGMPRRLS